MRILLLLSLVGIGSLNAAFMPLSYTLALIESTETYEGMHRILSLSIGHTPVGEVEYTIADQGRGKSFIHFLHVEREYRQKKGYGKLLFYTALKDIVQAGSSQVELQRHPFDLKYNESFEMRDNQLKRWYGTFGFVEKNDGTDYMQLVNPALLRNVEVVSRFSNSEITFNLERR